MGEPMSRLVKTDRPIGHREGDWVIVWRHWSLANGGLALELRAVPGETESDVFDRYNRVLRMAHRKVPASRTGRAELERLLQDDLDAELNRRLLDSQQPTIRFTYEGEDP